MADVPRYIVHPLYDVFQDLNVTDTDCQVPLHNQGRWTDLNEDGCKVPSLQNPQSAYHTASLVYTQPKY